MANHPNRLPNRTLARHDGFSMKQTSALISQRFRGYLPVVVDVETGGLNPATDALLEIAAVLTDMDENGDLFAAETFDYHIEPFEGSRLDPDSMAINGIRPDNPFRKEIAVPEKQALEALFSEVHEALNQTKCSRAILVGHNAFFDLMVMNAAIERTGLSKSNPFHRFSSFDTATLAGLAYGQTVLARALNAAGIRWRKEDAHSARYDAENTAELFCRIVNRYRKLGGWRH